MRCLLALMLVVLLSSSVRADRAAVVRVLEAMEDAVLRGDSGAYLEHVSAEDPVFRQEQSNWAADIGRHTPTAFDFSIGERAGPHDPTPMPEFVVGRADFELRVAWTLDARDTDGRGRVNRTVSFPVVFKQDASGRWLYHGPDWRVISRGSNRVLYYEGFEQEARDAVELLPDIREHVHEGLETTLSHTQIVKLYPSQSLLQFSIYPSYLDGLGGWNEPDESIKILIGRRGATRDSLRILLAHEYAHVVTFGMGSNATNIAWWLLEGVAELAAERYMFDGRDAKRFVTYAARNDNLVAWSELADFRTVRSEHHTAAYKQGHHLVGFVSERWGRSSRNEWVRVQATGRTLDEATRDILDLSFDELDAAWREAIQSDLGE